MSGAYVTPLVERLGGTRPTWAPVGGLDGATFVGNSLEAQLCAELVHDPVVTSASMARLHRARPHASLTTVAGAAHATYWEHAEVTQLIEAWS